VEKVAKVMNLKSRFNLFVCGGVAVAALLAPWFFAASRSEAAPKKLHYQDFRGDRCEICGTTNNVSWAHAYPQNMSKGTDKEYLIDSPTNGVTLCMPCQRCVGHYQNTSKYWNTRLIPIVRDIQSAKAEYEKRGEK
jgi:hypothetical protein